MFGTLKATARDRSLSGILSSSALLPRRYAALVRFAQREVLVSDVAGWERQIAENARRYQQLKDYVAQVALTETSRDGAVQVTVSASGVLTDLVLRERGQLQPLAQVAAEIMNCVRRAQARIPALLQNSIAATVGEQDPAAHLIVADARTRFPEPPPAAPRPSTVDEMRIGTQQLPAPAPMPSRREPPSRPPVARSGPTDDDWDERPVMEDI